MPKQVTKPAGKPASKPVHEIRYAGIRASIWSNDTEHGVRYNTTFERNYKVGEEWKTSSSFGRDDLLTLGFIAQEALRWIIEQRQEQPGQDDRSPR